MGKHKFDRKKAVRFTLVPGPIKDGKPTVLYKPVETKKSKLSKKEKKGVVKQFADIEQITINGKVVEQDEIPAYVLDQIRGRGDLVYNHMHQNEETEEGDLYELQDAAEDDEEYEEYAEYDFEKEGIREEQREDQGSEEWEDDEEYSDYDEQIEITEEEKPVPLKFKAKAQQFPALEQLHPITIEGVEYKLTKKQIEMLDIVIPENYEGMDFGGLEFKRYNEDGLLLSQKEKYQKYILGQDQKPVIIDTYEHVRLKPVDFIDNDLKPGQISGNVNIKEVEDALNYDGEEELYEELEDDFFAKMIQDQLKEAQPSKKKEPKTQKPLKQKQVQKPQKQVLVVQTLKMSEKDMEEQLNKAMFAFQNNIEDKNNKKVETDSDEDDEDDKKGLFDNSTTFQNYRDIQTRQELFGKDGQLDWRMLTAQEKKLYMKTKVQREFYDEALQRQIQQKMKGKSNVSPDELHLKYRVKHIPYEEDHVMQNALEEHWNEKGMDQISDGVNQSFSDEDDIVSFHQKTSIIATNLSVIEEPSNKKKKQKKEPKEDEEEQVSITKIKVVPQRRNRQETSQERRDRKNRLRDMKKQKKQQKKEFAERFNMIKKETVKRENPNNPLKNVAYVKIY